MKLRKKGEDRTMIKDEGVIYADLGALIKKKSEKVLERFESNY